MTAAGSRTVKRIFSGAPAVPAPFFSVKGVAVSPWGGELLNIAEGACACELDELYANWITTAAPVEIP